ncbi:MAG TPA: endolytic transglycosylase MltG [Candidatus Saccharimonadales bacterium]|nr:endolytic transglycosylase MltG [Candidatus Saccharimonadales bacterium]
MAKVTHYSARGTKKRRIRYFFYVVILLMAILFAVTIYIRHIYLERLKPLNNSQQSHLITVPSGSSLKSISDELQNDGIIRSSWAFEWYVRNDSNAINNLQAGTYNLRSNQTIQQIVTVLTQGEAVNAVVILPGQRIDQIQQALINDGFSETSVKAALNPAQYVSQFPMLAGLPQGATLEGFLYPNSFQKNTDTKVTNIIDQSLEEMQDQLTPQITNAFGKQGLSVIQAVTLASIVEQEVNKPSDKPVVAQVFLSRLRAGMNLGSDVTAYYGSIINNQKPSLSYDSPYNTLLHTGLPPGPISNVTSDDLNAVANPASTSYLYFVTGDNGVTYYAQTLTQHDQQVQAYCQKACSSSQ